MAFVSQEGEAKPSTLVRRLFEASTSIRTAATTGGDIRQGDGAKVEPIGPEVVTDTEGAIDVVSAEETSISNQDSAAVKLLASDSDVIAEIHDRNDEDISQEDTVTDARSDVHENQSRHSSSSGATVDSTDHVEVKAATGDEAAGRQSATTTRVEQQMPSEGRDTIGTKNVGQGLTMATEDASALDKRFSPVVGAAPAGAEENESCVHANGGLSSQSPPIPSPCTSSGDDGSFDAEEDKREPPPVNENEDLMDSEGIPPFLRGDVERQAGEGDAEVVLGDDEQIEQQPTIASGDNDDSDGDDSRGAEEPRRGGGDDESEGNGKETGQAEEKATAGPPKKGWSWGWSVPTWVGGGKNE